MPILQKISEEKNVPIMYLTFDSQTSQTGIKTRLEAFYDMLVMKREKEIQKKIDINKVKDKNKINSMSYNKENYEFQN